MREKLSVLVVDDDRRMARTICDILRINGYETEAAYTGEEAVAKAERGKPDCVFMDVKMPGVGGLEALKRLRNIANDLAVVLMSAYATEEQVEEARSYGAYTILTKPVDFQLVLSFLSLLRKEESILIVDDDPAFSKTLKEILISRGYRVETEISPANVLGDMEKEYKLVVLLDIRLGSADGLDILKDIRAKYPSKPVVLITGYGEEVAASVAKGLQIGAHTCLYKPFEVEELIMVIEDIRRRKLRALLGEPF